VQQRLGPRPDTALWEKRKDKVAVCNPVEDFSYGMREFAIRDNNGYILRFGEEISKSA
jgi:hypothetical protein